MSAQIRNDSRYERQAHAHVFSSRPHHECKRRGELPRPANYDLFADPLLPQQGFLGRDGQRANLMSGGVCHGRGHGGERRVDDDLADRLGAKRTRRLVARLKGHANAADIQTCGQLVAHKVAGTQAAAVIVLDDLVERVADTLGNAALGLNACERLVDHGAAVDGRRVVHHSHLAGGLVDLDRRRPRCS